MEKKLKENHSIAAIVLTKNEEHNIAECLEGLKSADEIIIVDCNSTDRTREIASRYTDKIYVKEMDHGFGPQRNFAIGKAHTEWILFIDADERVSLELWQEIIKSITTEKYNIYLLPRLTIFLGKPIYHCGWFEPNNGRLFRKGYARYNNAYVHEELIFEEEVEVAGRLSNSLYHKTYRNASHHLEKLNLYTTLTAEEFYKSGVRLRSSNYMWYFVIKPLLVFVRKFIVLRGYRDGVRGFFISFLSAFQYFEAYVKLWELQQSRH
jgi:glycosyltransferase involved in cell wall biosynthesis